MLCLTACMQKECDSKQDTSVHSFIIKCKDTIAIRIHLVREVNSCLSADFPVRKGQVFATQKLNCELR